jgi:hypothetical protein
VKRHASKIAAAILCLALAWLLSFPTSNWSGSAWLTIEADVRDAATGSAIADASATLHNATRTKKSSDADIASPSVLKTKTDSRGRGTLRDNFPAGGHSPAGTGFRVGNSSVIVEASGYLPVEVPVANSGNLVFRRVFFREQAHLIKLRFELRRP